MDEDKDDSKDEIDTTPLVFEGRSRIASVLFGALTTQTRLEALGLDLCKSPQTWWIYALCERHHADRSAPATTTSRCTTEPDLFPIVCPWTQRLFCLGNEQLSHVAQTFSFARLDTLQKHVESAHLRYLDRHQSLACPHPSCDAVLDGLEHFLNHAQRIHNNKLARDNYLRSSPLTDENLMTLCT